MSNGYAASNTSWFVIRTNPRQEERADSNLKAWNVETFAPRMRERRYNQFTQEPSHAVKPLFTGYIFARFDLTSLFHKVRFTRGIHSIVGFGGGPAPVDDDIIAIIKSRMDRDGFVRMEDDVKPGDAVVIRDGPLKDFTGIFERETKDADRVMILLNVVSYQAHVECDRALLKRIGHRACGS